MKCSTMSPVLPFLLTILQSFKECGGSGRLSIFLVDYKNPNHKVFNGDCCDNQWWCKSECENYFKFCLTAQGSIHRCSLGSFTTKVLGDDDFRFPGAGGSLGGDQTNPITYSFTKWQGANIGVDVWDDDKEHIIGELDDYVDRYSLAFTKPADVNQQTATPHNRKLSGKGTYMNVIIKVFCDDNYLIPDCQVHCTPRDDVSGHFTCNYTAGKKVCLDGWYDPTTNCVREKKFCIPVNDTSGHYECNSISGEKICLKGWTGPNCTEVWKPTPSINVPKTSTVLLRTTPEIQVSSSTQSGLYTSNSMLPLQSTDSSITRIRGATRSSRTGTDFTKITASSTHGTYVIETSSNANRRQTTSVRFTDISSTTSNYEIFDRSTEHDSETLTTKSRTPTSSNYETTIPVATGTKISSSFHDLPNCLSITSTLTTTRSSDVATTSFLVATETVATETSIPSPVQNFPSLQTINSLVVPSPSNTPSFTTTKPSDVTATSFLVATETDTLSSVQKFPNLQTISSLVLSSSNSMPSFTTTKPSDVTTKSFPVIVETVVPSSIHISPDSLSFTCLPEATSNIAPSTKLAPGTPMLTDTRPISDVTVTSFLVAQETDIVLSVHNLPQPSTVSRFVEANSSHMSSTQLVHATPVSTSNMAATDILPSIHILSITLTTSGVLVTPTSSYTPSTLLHNGLPTTTPRGLTDAVAIHIKHKGKWSQTKEDQLQRIITNKLNRVCALDPTSCSANQTEFVNRTLFNSSCILTLLVNDTDGEVTLLVKVKLPEKVLINTSGADFVPSAVLKRAVITERPVIKREAKLTVIAVQEVSFPPMHTERSTSTSTETPTNRRGTPKKHEPLMLYLLVAAGFTIFIFIIMLVLASLRKRRNNKVQKIHLLSESRKASVQSHELLTLSRYNSSSSVEVITAENIPLKKKSPRISHSARIFPEFNPNFSQTEN